MKGFPDKPAAEPPEELNPILFDPSPCYVHFRTQEAAAHMVKIGKCAHSRA
jgi:hypothetical protein